MVMSGSRGTGICGGPNVPLGGRLNWFISEGAGKEAKGAESLSLGSKETWHHYITSTATVFPW